MVQNAKYLLAQGKKEKAVAVLDKMQKAFPAKNFPLNNSIISMINDRAVMDAISVYLAAGERAKADKLANAMIAETEKAIILFSKIHNKALMSGDYLEQQLSYVLIISSIYKDAGDEATSKRYSDMVDVYLKPLQER